MVDAADVAVFFSPTLMRSSSLFTGARFCANIAYLKWIRVRAWDTGIESGVHTQPLSCVEYIATPVRKTASSHTVCDSQNIININQTP